MAIFNATIQSGAGPCGVYVAFCEDKEDLTAPAAEAWGEGSTVVCLNTKIGGVKRDQSVPSVPSIHVKLPDGSWNEVSNGG